MRTQALIALAAMAGALCVAQPAAAQDYYDDRYDGRQQCEQDRRDRVIGSALIGAIAGGVLGNNIAAGGHQGDGTLVGGLFGGLTGAALAAGRGDDCTDRYADDRDDEYSEVYDEGPYADDDGYYDEGRLRGSHDRRYAEAECRWGDMTTYDRRGRARGSERVWMCQDRDGVWRPA